MNAKSLKTLEYNKIISLLEEHADSDLGKEQCRNLLPSIDLPEIQKTQQETADAVSRLFKKGSTSFGNNYDLRYAVKSLEVGSTLSAVELLRIAGQLTNTARIKSYGEKEHEDSPSDSLDEYFESLHPLMRLADEINRCILSEDEIADDASPALKSI